MSEINRAELSDMLAQAKASEGHILGAWDGKFPMDPHLDRLVLQLARKLKRASEVLLERDGASAEGVSRASVDS